MIDMKKSFAVTLKGGTIGEQGGEYIRGERVIETFDTKEEAQIYSKGRNKTLTKGEKSYYKMKYSAVPIPKTLQKKNLK